MGKVVNGARRWLSIGPVGFQPSEVAKFAVLIYAADYMVRKMEVKERFSAPCCPWALRCHRRRAAAGRARYGRLHGGGRDAMGILFLGGVNARMFFPDRFAVLVAPLR